LREGIETNWYSTNYRKGEAAAAEGSGGKEKALRHKEKTTERKTRQLHCREKWGIGTIGGKPGDQSRSTKDQKGRGQSRVTGTQAKEEGVLSKVIVHTGVPAEVVKRLFCGVVGVGSGTTMGGREACGHSGGMKMDWSCPMRWEGQRDRAENRCAKRNGTENTKPPIHGGRSKCLHALRKCG